MGNWKRRIFEGDIFQASDGDYIQRYIITWNEDALEWSAECITDPEGTLPLSEFRVSEIEVIGNIFDNPELMANPKCSECKCCTCFNKSDCCQECEGAISSCEEYSETDVYNSNRLEGGAAE